LTEPAPKIGYVAADLKRWRGAEETSRGELMRVGQGAFQYELVEGWPEIPSAWDYRDVPGVATDAQDRVYLFSRAARDGKSVSSVLIHDRDGRFIGSWGEQEFTYAHGISIVGNVAYLTDLNNHTVYKCSLSGQILMTLGTKGVPSDTGFVNEAPANLTTIVRGGPPFNRPAWATESPKGEIFVADGYGNARVHRFSATGELLQSWGEPGYGPGQFMCSHGVWIHTDGRVFICDRDNDRIQIFDEAGNLVETWGDIPRAAELFIKDGYVYVTQTPCRKGRLSPAGKVWDRDRPSTVSVRTLDGKVVMSWAADSLKPEKGYFWASHGVCVDSRGDLYIGEVTATSLSSRVTGMPDQYRRGMSTIQKFRRV
jgi:sugar lactone lactonase YvrE